MWQEVDVAQEEESLAFKYFYTLRLYYDGKKRGQSSAYP